MELIDITNWEDDIFSDYGGYTRKCGKNKSIMVKNYME